MDRAFTVEASAQQVWPWLVQLGKQRAGWYFPASVERFIPPSRRAISRLDARWQSLAVGDIIPDYGGSKGYFEVAQISAPSTLVYRSTRGRTVLSWAITLAPTADEVHTTRVCLRLRVKPARPRSLIKFGEIIDVVTIAGMAAGLRERLAAGRDATGHVP